jgi:TRAP-type mannitol/chloroaromatic compound transport system permease small subunit
MRRLIDWLSILGGWALFVYCFFVAIEVVGRRFLNFSLQGVDEVGGYLMAIISAIGLSTALYARAHVRIDLLLTRLPWRVTMWLNVAALFSLFLFGLLLVERGWVVLAQSYSMRAISPTPLRTPMILPQGLWEGALLLFVIAAGTLCAIAVRHALRLEAEEVAALVGTSTSFADEGSAQD